MPKSLKQMSLYDPEISRDDTSTTFSDNLSLGVHRWFRYSAGYSADWVRGVLEKERSAGRNFVLDPFVGSGTTVLESQRLCLRSVGLEAHPLVFRVGQAKLLWSTDVDAYLSSVKRVLKHARSKNAERATAHSELLDRIFTGPSLDDLLKLRFSLESSDLDPSNRQLVWLTLCSILRECSTAGTAQWQYVLPNKSKVKVSDPFAAFERRALIFAHDMRERQSVISCCPKTAIENDDARTCSTVEDSSVDMVVTSPPYANNYDYADATRIEMTFFGEVSGWAELHDAVRQHLIRSCSQHAVRTQKEIPEMLRAPKLGVIAEELESKCNELAIVREGKGGKKPYHAMIAAYFYDMADVLSSLRRVTKDGGRMCLVVGDSAPYGVHIPVERWLGDLACSFGFRSYTFEKTRDRNTKWKNRKHTVPLHEGRLWIEA